MKKRDIWVSSYQEFSSFFLFFFLSPVMVSEVERASEFRDIFFIFENVLTYGTGFAAQHPVSAQLQDY